jgi:hypothetical protein
LAYGILIALSKELLKENKGNVLNTGKIKEPSLAKNLSCGLYYGVL